MPLVKANQDNIVRIDAETHPDFIAAGEWFEIKSKLSWHELEGLKQTQMVKLRDVAVAAKQQGGKKGDDEQADEQAEDTPRMNVDLDIAGYKLSVLSTFLVRWSFKEALNRHNIRHLDPRTAGCLLREATRLMKEMRGPVADSPLDVGSDGSLQELAAINQAGGA